MNYICGWLVRLKLPHVCCTCRVYEKYGITSENVAAKAVELVAFYQGKAVPSLINRPDFSSSGGVHKH